MAGVAISVIFAFLRWVFPAVPKPVAWSGVLAGAVVLLLDIMMPQLKLTYPVVGLFLTGSVCIAAAVHLAFPVSRQTASAEVLSARDLPVLTAMGDPRYGLYLIVFNPTLGDKTGPWEVKSARIPDTLIAPFDLRVGEDVQASSPLKFSETVESVGHFHSRIHPTPQFLHLWVKPVTEGAFLKNPRLELQLLSPNGQSFPQTVPIKLVNLPEPAASPSKAPRANPK